MNGLHDCGGMDGFGPVLAGEDGELFHAGWERRVFALLFAVSAVAKSTGDRTRSIIEGVSPARYAERTYYEGWLDVVETLVLATGGATQAELNGGPREPRVDDGPAPSVLTYDILQHLLRHGRPGAGHRAGAPRFAEGSPIRARNLNPRGHTRLPRYARGRRGVVVKQRGVYAFPDSVAAGIGPDPQHLYTVRFDSEELWGPGAERHAIHIDLFESYLDAEDA